MRFRKPVVALVAAGVLLTAAGCGGGSTSTGGNSAPKVSKGTFDAGTTMDTLSKGGKIRVGTKFDQPLFGLKGLSNTPEGFDVEVAKIIAGSLGIAPDKIEWVETPSKIREEAIESNKVDVVVATYTINDKRKERVSFAGPYYLAGQQLMVKKDNKAITKPEDLKTNPGQKVCSVTGSTPAETIKKYVAAPDQLILFDTYDKCADALRTGQVHVVTTDNVILMGFVEKNKDFTLVGEQFTKEPYGIGIKKGDKAFCEYINKTLKDNSAAYETAWKSTAGKVEGAKLPTLPTPDPCS